MDTDRRKPLQVYLDSSDYSRLSDPKTRAEFNEVHSYLLDRVDRGQIEVRFGCMNVYEALPLVREAAELAALRLACIKRLCGKKCLKEFWQLVQHELSPVGLTRSDGVLVDSGAWHPDPGEIKLPDPMQAIGERARNSGQNRKQRRARGIGSRAQLANTVRATLSAMTDDELARRAFRHPITPAAAKTLRRFLCGEITHVQMQTTLQESFSDLDCWTRWYQLNWDEAISAAIVLRAKGEWLKATLSANVERLQKSGQELLSIGYPEQRKKALVDEMIRSHRRELPEILLAALRQQFSFVDSGQNSWEACPGLLLMSRLVAEMSLQTALLDTNVRRPRQSDLGDVLHALYAPYVDVFRADVAIASMISAINPPISTKIVGRLEDLPNQIEMHPKFNAKLR